MLKSGEPFAMAGIYARGRDHQLGDAENTTVTFAILTTAANEIMQPIHERMSVICSYDGVSGASGTNRQTGRMSSK